MVTSTPANYSALTEAQRTIAPKIEKILDGMSVADAIKLLHSVRRAIEDKGIIKSA